MSSAATRARPRDREPVSVRPRAPPTGTAHGHSCTVRTRSRWARSWRGRRPTDHVGPGHSATAGRTVRRWATLRTPCAVREPVWRPSSKPGLGPGSSRDRSSAGSRRVSPRFAGTRGCVLRAMRRPRACNRAGRRRDRPGRGAARVPRYRPSREHPERTVGRRPKPPASADAGGAETQELLVWRAPSMAPGNLSSRICATRPWLLACVTAV